MKTILRISRNELRNLFFSPIAWFTLIVFLIVGVLSLYRIFDLNVKFFWTNAENNPYYLGNEKPYTKEFSCNYFFLRFIGENLRYFIPLLTMGLINREVNQGTIRLLFSTPTKLWQIIAGKYIGISVFNLLLLMILSIFHLVTAYTVENVESGLLFSSLLAFYLQVSLYTAIGLFMSSLSNYQIVSAILTFLAIFSLDKIQGLWQHIDFVRDLTWFLSSDERVMRMNDGLISSKDVIYFILISLLFIVMTYLVLLRGRRHERLPVVIGRYILLIAVVLGLGYLSSRPRYTLYWDTTRGQVNTLHPRTQQLLAQMKDEPMEVTVYCNIVGLNGQEAVPEARNKFMRAMWEKYQRFSPEIKFNFVYYYTPSNINSFKTARQVALELADMFNVPFSIVKTPKEINKIADLAPEGYQLVMQLKYKGQTAFLRTYNPKDRRYLPDEIHVAAAMNTIVRKKAVKGVLIEGHLERRISGSERDMNHLTDRGSDWSLKNLGFEFSSCAVDSTEIPKDADILVLADPRVAITPVAISRIEQYIQRGGNIMILGEPYKQPMLNPLLKPLGVQLRPGILTKVTKYALPDNILTKIADSLVELSEDDKFQEIRFINAKKAELNLPKSSDNFSMMSACAVADSSAKYGLHSRIFSIAGSGAWAKMGRLVTDSAAPVFTAAEGDYFDTFNTVLGLTRTIDGREQRIVVAGDADFMSDRKYFPPIGNSIYHWLSDSKAPIYLPRPYPTDVRLKATTAEIGRILYFLKWGLPAILIVFAAILLIRRKRR